LSSTHSSKGEEALFVRKFREYWVPFLLGVGAFWFITGGRIIRPGKINWLMINGDSAQHYLGWVFYRHAPFFQWPMGSIKNFGMDISSSIVYTDSIPLLAMIFKPFSYFLPEKFQFLGIWILACFVLQSLFAWKLLGLFTKDKILLLLGSTFFVLAPAPLWRMGGHHALFGHWIILAAIYLCLSSKFSIVRWTGLLVSAVLIHAYLLIMSGLIFLADLIQRSWRKEIKFGYLGLTLLIAGAFIAFSMWASGYFMLSSGILEGEAGVYRMNLLSIIDPNGWSKLLQDQSQGASDYFEAFNFLGIGIILLGLLSIYEYLRNPGIVRNYRRVIPLATALILFTIYAISNHIALGKAELFQYQWPSIMNFVVGAFRSTARFFWPPYYAIYLLSMAYLFSKNSGKGIRIAVAAVLCLQVVDSWEIYTHYRKMLSFAPVWTSPMRSNVWSEFAGNYRNLMVVPPANHPDNWIALAQIAADNKMAINIGDYARIDRDRLDLAVKKMANSISRGEFSPNSLYVFNDDNLWNTAKASSSPEDFVGVLDNFRVYAPKAKRFMRQTAVEAH
jgi:hypothetical protein